ncbi:MAG TPA: hypothetical protein VGO89_20665 [Streptomyces sp.]|nr:hypothetical protein [Streptomyces sp.]
MRATRAATAALTLTLSCSLALGIAGTAAAGTQNTPSATDRAVAPDDAESTIQQIRTIKDLGRLAELTGTLGRVSRDGEAAALKRELQQRIDRQIRRVLKNVQQERRPAATLPAIGEEGARTTSTVVTLTDASHTFRQSVNRVAESRSRSAKSRTAASRTLLDRLGVVNRLAMNDVGLDVEQTRTPMSSFYATSPRAAITTTLIDRVTLPSGGSDRLRRHDDAIEAISDLVEDVQESRDGRLSQAEADEHAAELDQSLTQLRHRAGTRDESGLLSLETVDSLDKHVDALLRASRIEDTSTIRSETGRMVRESVKLLSSSLLASQVPDSIDESDAIDAGADADDWMWAGTPLSPMLR